MFLCTSRNVKEIDNIDELCKNKVSIMEAEAMCRRVTKKEIWEVLVSIDDNKAPRLDGYLEKFYKAAWSIMGKEVEEAIQYNGDVNYVSVIREALEEFSDVSGLYPNLSKSVMFCNNVNEETKEAILQVGEKVQGKAKIAWKDVCKPKCKGGLGLKPLDIWNKVLMTRHLWNVASKKDFLWVKWINVYRLKGKNLWEVDYDCNASWGWRKLLELKEMTRPHIWSNIMIEENIKMKLSGLRVTESSSVREILQKEWKFMDCLIGNVDMVGTYFRIAIRWKCSSVLGYLLELKFYPDLMMPHITASMALGVSTGKVFIC
ncbi:hypothetical protein Tco_0942210 [Tanacetum coccineum]